MTEITKLTASKIKPGMIIRRYAPYTWWLDWQRVTSVEPVKTYDGSRVKGYKITREDGNWHEVSPAARFEVELPAEPSRPLAEMTGQDLAALANSGDAAALAEWQAREDDKITQWAEQTDPQPGCTSEDPNHPGLMCSYVQHGPEVDHFAQGYTWPADDTSWPAGKTFGQLTPAQRAAAIKSAAAKFQAELTANASALGKVLEDFEAGHRAGDVLTGDEIADCQMMGANPPVVAAIILRDAEPLETTITRQRLGYGANRRVMSWLYSYTSPVQQDLTRRDGTPYVIAKGQTVTHGESLISLRDWLRRNFGRDIKITEEWKVAEPVHVRTPGKAYDRQGNHTGPGQWLSVIHEANRIDPEMFGEPQCHQGPEGWTEVYPNARVIHRSDASVSVISTTAHGREVLAEAARRLGL
jgi:hypothetical protein